METGLRKRGGITMMHIVYVRPDNSTQSSLFESIYHVGHSRKI
jgi:hypothetical protein